LTNSAPVTPAPVQDAFAVGLGVGQHPRAGARGDQHDVGSQLADRAVVCGDLDGVRSHAGHVVDQLAATRDQRHALALQASRDIDRLCGRQLFDAVVDLRELDLGVLELQRIPEIGCAAQLGAHAGGRDERLGRHAVPQHAGTADAVGVDDGDVGDLGAAGRGDQCRLIAGRPTADDHDAGCHGP